MGNSPTGPADIVNRAIVLMGGFNSNVPLTGVPPIFDGTPLGLAAGAAYGGVVQTVGKACGWDFARNVAVLVLSGNSPPYGWFAEYLYPTNGIEVRQVLQSVAAQVASDPNNPAPQLWQTANNVVAGATRKVIWCNLVNALAVISGQPIESAWDAGFTEEVVRLLASDLAMAVAGRPETGQLEYERSNNAAQIFHGREG
jgi:hypothetical protein